jgi:hypothetical protein
MYDLGVFQIKPIKKIQELWGSFRKVSPHGDTSVYDAMVVQDFENGYAVSIWTDSQRTLDYTCNDKIARNAAETKISWNYEELDL